MVARVDREGMSLVIIGTSSAVRSVRLMLDTQVGAHHLVHFSTQ